MKFALRWTLQGAGWATCVVDDGQREAELLVSYVGDGPEELLTAVARLVTGVAAETRLHFNEEPTVSRWVFQLDGEHVAIRIFMLVDGNRVQVGTEVWSARVPMDTLARATVRCFDQVLYECEPIAYEDQWGRPFPELELRALKVAWRQSAASAR